MRYMGSKARIAKDILPIILKGRGEFQWYVEPFVGGFNIMDKVKGKRIASDNHRYLIALFIAIQKGWVPPDTMAELEYQHIRQNKNKYPDYLVGFVGFACSFGGKWFGGHAKGNDNNGNPRNHYDESRRHLLKQTALIKNVVIFNKNYYDLPIPCNSIIYCDPPYANVTKYKSQIDHDRFWNWVRERSEEGHKVFVSEYSAPDDFECVWSKDLKVYVTRTRGHYKANVKRLFVYKNA